MTDAFVASADMLGQTYTSMLASNNKIFYSQRSKVLYVILIVHSRKHDINRHFCDVNSGCHATL